jgi:dCTP deaminase
MGYSKLPVNKVGEQYVVRENGLPLIMCNPNMRVEDCEEFTPYTDEQKAQFKPMIEPFESGQVRTMTDRFPSSTGEDDVPRKIVSYGTSSYGYDLRCGNKFKIFTNINSTVIDPKNFDEKSFVDFEGDVCIIPPNSFALASSVEYFRIPRDVLTVCLGKSTYARCGIIVNVTPFEPEWEGYVTLEFSNTTPLPAKIYANEGVAQVLFFQGDEVCETSYKDRAGKYMNQSAEPIPPRT